MTGILMVRSHSKDHVAIVRS